LSVAIGDMNKDGNPDIVAANYGSNTVSVLLGHGNGSFDPKLDYATGHTPWMLAGGDLGGGGRPGIATANRPAGSRSVWLGHADGTSAGTFLANQDYATGDEPRSVAIGDLNKDGVPDLVTANWAGDSVSVLLAPPDTTPPSAAPTLSPPPTAAGWNRSAVTV